ncbi:MAG: response regulator transcription factor [Deltaproteobacteria bacterium]|nr:response regulator transcription factor [Deltaproteobacteria bacterium]
MRVNAAASGTMGKRWLGSSPPDLALQELNLDDVAQAEFVETVKQAVPHVGFLLVEDRDRAGQIARALEFGVDAYISTPPDEERLFSAIDRLLQAVAARSQRTSEQAQLVSHLDEVQQEKAQLQMQLTNLEKSAREFDDGFADSQTMALNALLSQEGSFEDALQVVQTRFDLPRRTPLTLKR